MNFCCSALFHLKTRVRFKCFINDCRSSIQDPESWSPSQIFCESLLALIQGPESWVLLEFWILIKSWVLIGSRVIFFRYAINHNKKIEKAFHAINPLFYWKFSFCSFRIRAFSKFVWLAKQNVLFFYHHSFQFINWNLLGEIFKTASIVIKEITLIL